VVYNLATGRIDGGGDGSRIQLRIKPKAIDELGVQDDTSTGGAR
jgi:hypothetical protein